MVRVITYRKYKVYVYAEYGQPHHLPHRDVIWPDGEAQVSLPNLQVIIGDPLPREMLTVLVSNRARLVAAWNALNPERNVQ
jgi:hypothetical protein